MPKRKINRAIKAAEAKIGPKGKRPHTTRRIYRELSAMARRSPGYAPVKKHTALVKRFSNQLAKALQAKHVMLDRGLVNQGAIAHDSMRDLKEHDSKTQILLAKKGAPAVSRVIGSGESWTMLNHKSFSLEKKLVIYGDYICRGVKVGNTFMNGVLPSKTAFRLLVSQRQASPERVDNLVRERQVVMRFEADLRAVGIDPNDLIREHMKRNPKTFLDWVQQVMDPNFEKAVKASMKRLGTKKLDY